jgi:hypothetical protein
MNCTGEEMTTYTGLVHIAQAAADFGRFAQRLMKILQVEDGRALVRQDEVQRGSRRFGVGRRSRLAWAAHALGETPGPDGEGPGRKRTIRHLGQDPDHALLLGRPDVGQRPAGFEDLPNRFGRAALRRLGNVVVQ